MRWNYGIWCVITNELGENLAVDQIDDDIVNGGGLTRNILVQPTQNGLTVFELSRFHYGLSTPTCLNFLSLGSFADDP